MSLPEATTEQGGLEQVSGVDRVASLTGIRAVAALLVLGTHAAYTTGKYTHGYFGLICARLEIGVPIFFVLSGFLLFRPWVKAAATYGSPPSVSLYARHRVRRIMPAYLLTVVAAYIDYHFHSLRPNPGHTWIGLFRNLTLTQIYTGNYLGNYLHQGLTQMWSLSVEVAFYLVLPALAYLLLTRLCRRRWQPVRLLAGLGGLALISPAWLTLVHTNEWLPNVARLWLPSYLIWFVAGMVLAVLQAMGAVCYALMAIPLAVISYLIAATPIGGAPTTAPTGLLEAVVKSTFYAVIAALAVAPLALGNQGWYAAVLASRPMVWLGEISYEIFLVHLLTMEVAMVELVHYRIYTGSMVVLFVLTLVLTIPPAWLLHRVTRVR
jgi:peptidoglycan/LPS O-acetylase OafA/YrhL